MSFDAIDGRLRNGPVPPARVRAGLSATAWRWWSLAPALIMFGAIAVLPLVNLAALSFSEVKWAGGEAQWSLVGWDHYVALLRDSVYLAGLRNTFLFAVVSVAIQIVLGFSLALLVSRLAVASRLYKSVFVLPILIPGIVVGVIWKLMYDPDFGVLNQILGHLNLGPYNFAGSPQLAMASIIVVDVWHWTPFVFLLMLAGVESLPQDIYEAAKVDGTGFWRELRYITLPLMLPTIVVTLIFRAIMAFKVFDEIYVITSGGPGTATEVISFSIYRTYFMQDRSGYGSALSFTTMLVVTAIIVAALTVQRFIQRRS